MQTVWISDGLDYGAALRDYSLVGGAQPLPPRYAFGVWYSRWWPFADFETSALVDQFEDHGVPLDTVVSDMDWHHTCFRRTYGSEDEKSSGFAMASFVSETGEMIDLDDPSFWTKMLPDVPTLTSDDAAKMDQASAKMASMSGADRIRGQPKEYYMDELDRAMQLGKERKRQREEGANDEEEDDEKKGDPPDPDGWSAEELDALAVGLLSTAALEFAANVLEPGLVGSAKH